MANCSPISSVLLPFAVTYQTVVWNPWRAKCTQINDLNDDDFESFLCVENGIVVPPHVISTDTDTFTSLLTYEPLWMTRSSEVKGLLASI